MGFIAFFEKIYVQPLKNVVVATNNSNPYNPEWNGSIQFSAIIDSIAGCNTKLPI